MALKTYKPTSPGQRGLVLVDKSHLSKERPVKSLTEGLTSSGGRNNKGRMTARRRGGGHKRLYRKIDFKRNKLDISATVERLEYDPNRSAFIALLEYKDGENLLEGFMAWDEDTNESRPGILVGHAWAGRSKFECTKAEDLAKLGYVGFALDVYGKGITGRFNAIEKYSLNSDGTIST